jgi:hypothetical protein
MKKIEDPAGTPKSMNEAIARAVMVAGPIGEICQVLHFYMRDFLAHRFNAAFFEAKSEDEVKRLEALFEKCVKQVEIKGPLSEP